jgi:hypothetical protein
MFLRWRFGVHVAAQRFRSPLKPSRSTSILTYTLILRSSTPSSIFWHISGLLVQLVQSCSLLSRGSAIAFVGRMPDDLRSPIKHHLVLHRINPKLGIRRFYSLMIERDLFGTVRLVRNWGRIGMNGWRSSRRNRGQPRVELLPRMWHQTRGTISF